MTDCMCCRVIPGPSKTCPTCGFWERAGLTHNCDEENERRTKEFWAMIPEDVLAEIQE